MPRAGNLNWAASLEIVLSMNKHELTQGASTASRRDALIGSASTPRTKVCLVAGWSRSGTTIIGRILGQLNGFIDVGELMFLWQSLEIDGWRCGCGERLTDCRFWKSVATQSNNTVAGSREITRFWRSSARLRHVPKLWWFNSRPAPVVAGERTLATVYREIAANSSARVIVDTSKTPAYALIAKQVPEVDVYVLHIVRDPRAVAYSWLRPRPSASGITGDEFESCSTSRSAVHWVGNNVALATFVRRAVRADHYLRIRYEDFASEPRIVTLRIVNFLGERVTDTPFESERSVRLAPTHTASGNPARFRNGLVDIVPDEQWRTELPQSARRKTLALAGSLMPAMGYNPLR